MASTEIPEPGSYRFVLVTIRGYDPSVERLASTYSESHQSRNIEHPDGRRRPTVFFSDRSGVERLQKMGWEDVSAAWFAAHPEADPAVHDARRVAEAEAAEAARVAKEAAKAERAAKAKAAKEAAEAARVAKEAKAEAAKVEAAKKAELAATGTDAPPTNAPPTDPGTGA